MSERRKERLAVLECVRVLECTDGLCARTNLPQNRTKEGMEFSRPILAGARGRVRTHLRGAYHARLFRNGEELKRVFEKRASGDVLPRDDVKSPLPS